MMCFRHIGDRHLDLRPSTWDVAGGATPPKEESHERADP